MRLIGSIPEEDVARRFADYLLTRGIPMTVDEGSQGWALWVEHDDHVEQARRELEEYEKNPADPKYRAATHSAGRIRAGEDRKQRRLHQRFIDVRTSWAQGMARPRPLMIALILISLVVAAASWAGYKPQVLHPLYISLDESTRSLPEVRSGQIWRLITPIFIHFGPLHLIFNMFWLRDLGAIIESRRGTRLMTILVLAAAILPNLLQYLVSGPGFGGMSGVVYALFGYIWMKQRYYPEQGMSLHDGTVFIMLAWLVLAMTGLVGDVANAAHLGGLAVGVIAGAGPHFLRKLQRRLRRVG